MQYASFVRDRCSCQRTTHLQSHAAALAQGGRCGVRSITNQGDQIAPPGLALLDQPVPHAMRQTSHMPLLVTTCLAYKQAPSTHRSTSFAPLPCHARAACHFSRQFIVAPDDVTGSSAMQQHSIIFCGHHCSVWHIGLKVQSSTSPVSDVVQEHVVLGCLGNGLCTNETLLLLKVYCCLMSGCLSLYIAGRTYLVLMWVQQLGVFTFHVAGQALHTAQ